MPATAARQRAQYQWFVGYLLTICEEILLTDASEAWRATLARQLKPHRPFLNSPAFLEGPYAGLTADVRVLIGKVVAAEEVVGEPAGVRDSTQRR